MKCGFKTNKILTAVAETDHTVTTSEGRVIHKKLVFRPLKFQIPKKLEEPRKATNRCRRCGKFSSGDLCETHLRLKTTKQDDNNNNNNEPSTSHTLPTMPNTSNKKKRTYNRVITYDSSSQDSESNETSAPKDSSEEEELPDDTALRAEIGREIDRIRSQTPMPTSPVGCSTKIATDAPQPDTSGTPILGQNAPTTAEVEPDEAGKAGLKYKINTENGQSNLNLEPRRSKRIKTAQRVVKLGGVEYF